MSNGWNATTFAPMDILAAAHRAGLTPSEVGRGVLATHRNARRLMLDAVCLFENQRYPGALSMAILANEESGKALTLAKVAAYDVTLPPAIALAWPPHRVTRRLWRTFGDHEAKHQETIRLHMGIGNVPPDAKDVADFAAPALAKIYATKRERATYADCVQGQERWSVPEVIVSRGATLTTLRNVRQTLEHIITPAVAVAAVAQSERMVAFSSRERIRAMLDWSESEEAHALSKADLIELVVWQATVDAALERADEEGDASAGPSA